MNRHSYRPFGPLRLSWSGACLAALTAQAQPAGVEVVLANPPVEIDASVLTIDVSAQLRALDESIAVALRTSDPAADAAPKVRLAVADSRKRL
jgi:hypothetical protein